MSRHYDALIKASREMENGSASDAGVVPVSSEAPEPKQPLPAVEAASPAVEAAAPEAVPAAVAPAAPSDIWKIPSPDLPVSAIGTIASARAVLDRTARLVTNTSNLQILEHYRRLRTKVMQEHAAKPFRTLVVSSPNSKEGKTVTVLNLALTFDMLPGFRVLVIDGDLRRGSLSEWTGLTGQPGLSNVIEGAPISSAIHHCGDLSIQVMPTGTSLAAPSELLHSDSLHATLAAAASMFDLVLIDTPPVNVLTDAQVIAEHCDAVLMVARAFYTSQKALERAAAEVNRFRVIGTVLNGGPRTRLNGYAARDYYYKASGKK